MNVTSCACRVASAHIHQRVRPKKITKPVSSNLSGAPVPIRRRRSLCGRRTGQLLFHVLDGLFGEPSTALLRIPYDAVGLTAAVGEAGSRPLGPPHRRST